MRTALFWVITQRVVVISYRRFRTTLRPLYMGPIDCPETSVRNYHYSKERRILVSQNTTLYIVNFIIRLTTCFGPFAGPSSGHKVYKEEKLYSVSNKI